MANPIAVAERMYADRRTLRPNVSRSTRATGGNSDPPPVKYKVSMAWSGCAASSASTTLRDCFHQGPAPFIECVHADGDFLPVFSNPLQIDGDLAAVGIERFLLLAAFVK